LFAGTDDGNVWMTHDDGATWQDLTSRFPGLPATEAYVTGIEPSHADTLTFYVVFDNHRVNDPRPYLYGTHDGGRTFRLLTNGLPADGPADYLHVMREDPRNPNLLFAGSSIGVYASTDRGATWTRFMTGLPSVPVFDLQIHTRERELVAATHGRSLWIADIGPLEDSDPRALTARSYLYEPRTALQWTEPTARGNAEGNSTFETLNPPYGALITYRLGSAVPGGAVSILVSNAAGESLSTIRGPGDGPGVRSVVWNYQISAPLPSPLPLSASMRRDSVLRAVRAPAVIDSLRRAGFDPVAITRASELIESAQFGGAAAGGRNSRAGSGRGARVDGASTSCERPSTQWDLFCARPAEGPTQGPRSIQGPFTSPLVVNGADPVNVLRVFDLIGFSYFNTPGGRAWLGSGNAATPGPTLVAPGDYTLTLIAGSDTTTRRLHIERATGAMESRP
ncbi:MAG: hypothetical protein NTW72_05430, partial [Gemmatimonadetes bacterium]|nr:hypothetical protein [Gemmatimonadota bacterium]